MLSGEIIIFVKHIAVLPASLMWYRAFLRIYSFFIQ
jgi:hypothetical protein